MESTVYHKVLRISIAVVAVVLLFQSGLVSQSTSRLALQTQQYVANAVGITVGVTPTELNQITADLTKRETALATREQSVQEREIAVKLSGGGGMSQTTTTFILASALFVLLVLVVLNYILDFVRTRRTRLVPGSNIVVT